MPITNYLRNELLDAALGNVAYTTPSTVYMSLHSTLGNATTAGTELSGNNYSRQTATFGSASNGIIATTANIAFTANGGNWTTATSSEIYDASTGGNRLFYGKIVPKTLLNGETVTFLAGDVKISLT